MALWHKVQDFHKRSDDPMKHRFCHTPPPWQTDILIAFGYHCVIRNGCQFVKNGQTNGLNGAQPAHDQLHRNYRHSNLVIYGKCGDLHCHRNDVHGGINERWFELFIQVDKLFSSKDIHEHKAHCTMHSTFQQTAEKF
jgi:hypothetical protein